MKKQIMIIILGLVLVTLASAMYPGETDYTDLSNEMDSYTNYWIEGNTSAINVTMNKLIVAVQIPADYLPGDFTIIFNGTKKGKVVEVPVNSGSSGGTRTVYKDNIIYVDRNNTLYKNNTIYLEKSCSDNIFDLNQTNQTINFIEEEQEHLNWLQRFWNWIKGIFH